MIEELNAPDRVSARKSLKRLEHGPPQQRLWRYGPLVVWASLIFLGSSDLLSAPHTSAFLLGPLRWLYPNASEATLAALHLMIRKAGHFTEYAILGLLAARAFRSSSRGVLRNHRFWMSLLFVMVYSLSDEFHQWFVPSRTASIYDSMIDIAGGMAGLILMRIHHRIRTGSGSD